MTGPAALPSRRPGRPAHSPRGRSDRPPPECHARMGPHAERVRLYPSGWLCDWHSPWHRAGRPDPTSPPKDTT